MQSMDKPRGQRRLASFFPVAAAAAATVLLAACGGTNSSSPDDVAAVPPAMAVTPKSCNNIGGSFDAVQSALTEQLRPAVAGLPTVGTPAATATTALSQTLDTVDALSTALITLARTQNTQQFTAQLGGAGDSLLCSGSSLGAALGQLAGSQSTPVPGLATVQASLVALSQRVSTGLVGTTPGADLTAITSQLTALAQQLQSLSGNLPVVANQPYLARVLSLNATAFSSLATILADVGALNGTKLGSDVGTLASMLANGLPLSMATQFGVPVAALNPVTSQLGLAAQTLGSTTAAVAAPTLQAVSAVLGGASSATGAAASSAVATGSFSDLLAGGLANGASAASTARVNGITQQLAGNSGLTLLAALLSSFGGRLPV